MLDDALIHLRYATRSLDAGFLTYDGQAPSYGVSSLLYVAVLAALRLISDSALVPKLVSVAGYLVLLVVLGRSALTRDRNRAIWFLLLLVCASPFALRWLTDGMETVLILLGVVVGANAFFRLGQDRDLRASCVASGIAMLLVALRVELLGLVLGAVAAATALGWERHRTRRPLMLAMPVLASAAVAVGVALAFGYLLPDTAVAKVADERAWRATSLVAIAASLGAAGTFGLGLLSLYGYSAVLALRAAPPGGARVAALLANGLFVAVCAGIVARGQAVQGVRHLVWALAFPICWNAAMPAPEKLFGTPTKYLSSMLTVVVAVGWLVEAPLVHRIVSGRGQTFLQFQCADWSTWNGRRAIAGDIGMFGYFSETQLCDVAGLVHGRAVAALPAARRVERCVQEEPVAAFLSDGQAAGLSGSIPLDQWRRCGFVDFSNVRGDDRHYLYVDPTRLDCPPAFEAVARAD